MYNRVKSTHYYSTLRQRDSASYMDKSFISDCVQELKQHKQTEKIQIQHV